MKMNLVAALLLCWVRGEDDRRRLRSHIFLQRHGSDRRQAAPDTKAAAQASGRPSELMLADPAFFDRYYKGYSDRDVACTPRPMPQSPLRWHHIAKTGQSFLFTIVRIISFVVFWTWGRCMLWLISRVRGRGIRPRIPFRSFEWSRKICSYAGAAITRD